MYIKNLAPPNMLLNRLLSAVTYILRVVIYTKEDNGDALILSYDLKGRVKLKSMNSG